MRISTCIVPALETESFHDANVVIIKENWHKPNLR